MIALLATVIAVAMSCVATADTSAVPEVGRADDSTGLPVAVDPRVELLAIVARLAGAREYSMPNSRSPYSERVEAQFGPFREHAAIRSFQALRRDQGVSYDAVMSLAMHVGELPALEERIDFDGRPERLDARCETEPTRAFLRDLRQFVQDTDAVAFFKREQPYYDAAAASLRRAIEAEHPVAWFDRYFGAKAGASYRVTPGLLCGGGNYGVGVRFPDGRVEEIRPVLGCARFDEKGVPVFTADVMPLLVHELCHSYTNRIVDAHAEELRPAGERIFPSVESRMRRMAYSNWQTMMYETFVRACVVRYMADGGAADGTGSDAGAERGSDAGARQAESERAQGFAWVPELAKSLERYESERERFPTFEAFVPELVAVLNAYEVPPPAASNPAAPKVVSMTPANGAEGVDPSLTAITVTFDRPMRDGSWSFVGSPTDMPKTKGPPSYDKARTTITLPIELEPGRTYTFSLNSDRFRAFASAGGVPLEPVAVRFSTRD